MSLKIAEQELKTFDRKRYMKHYHKKWYTKHRRRLLLAMKKYAHSHATQLRKYKKIWYMANQKSRLRNARRNYLATRHTTRRLYNLKTLYGLSIDDYNTLLNKQQNRCAICRVASKRRLSVDHCHRTKRIRGLLCTKCNFAIGLLKDNISLFEAAVCYLKEN